MSTLAEEWRTVPHAPDYQVSSIGRVRRATNGKTGAKAGYILSTGVRNPREYPCITLVLPDGSKKKGNVHILVCRLFNGEPPSPEHKMVAHLNGNPHDNRAENLTWATAKINCHHKYEHGTMAFGERSRNNKLTEAQAMEIRSRRLCTRAAYIAASKEFSINPETVARVARGESWAHLPKTREVVRTIGVRK